MKKYIVLKKATEEDKGAKYIIINGLGQGTDNIMESLKLVLNDPDSILAETISITGLKVMKKDLE